MTGRAEHGHPRSLHQRPPHAASADRRPGGIIGLVPLSDADRATVIDTAADLIRSHEYRRLLAILQERVERGDYPDPHERELDRVACAIARAIDEQRDGG